jgi:hypothetical protein
MDKYRNSKNSEKATKTLQSTSRKRRPVTKIQKKSTNNLNITQKITRQSYWKYIENIVTQKEEEPHSGMKKFWTYIKHKRKDNIGISSLMMNGKLFCDPASKSNILNRQFKSAFSAKTKFTKKEFIKSKRMDPSIKHQTMQPFNITTNGIIKQSTGTRQHLTKNTQRTS